MTYTSTSPRRSSAELTIFGQPITPSRRRRRVRTCATRAASGPPRSRPRPGGPRHARGQAPSHHRAANHHSGAAVGWRSIMRRPAVNQRVRVTCDGGDRPCRFRELQTPERWTTPERRLGAARWGASLGRYRAVDARWCVRERPCAYSVSRRGEKRPQPTSSSCPRPPRAVRSPSGSPRFRCAGRRRPLHARRVAARRPSARISRVFGESDCAGSPGW